MPDYSKAKIYQVKNYIDDEIYVGSTCETLARRMTKHRYDVQRNSSLKTKFEEHGADKFYIELIEDYPCSNKQELLAREGHFIRERGTINKRIAGRSSKQWHEENKEEQAIQQNKYYEEHIEVIRARNKAWDERNRDKIHELKNTLCLCECGLYYTHTNKNRHMRSLPHKRQTEQADDPKYVKCECGQVVYKNGISRHLKLSRHTQYLELNQQKILTIIYNNA